MRSILSTTLHPILDRTSVDPLLTRCWLFPLFALTCYSGAVLPRLVLALGASPLSAFKSSTRCCSLITFAHFLSLARAFRFTQVGRVMSRMYVSTALALNCASFVS